MAAKESPSQKVKRCAKEANRLHKEVSDFLIEFGDAITPPSKSDLLKAQTTLGQIVGAYVE